MHAHKLPLCIIVALLASASTGRCSASPLFGAAFLSFDTGDQPNSVSIGDLNGDGKSDIVVADRGSHSVSVLLRNGDGTFGPKMDFDTGFGPTSVSVGDLNGNGTPDLAVANNASGTVSILLGNGDGSFGPKTDLATGYSPNCVTMGDFNADGKPDLAVTVWEYSTSTGKISVFLGNGDGSFAAKTDFPTASTTSTPQSVAVGDFNGDEKPDLAVVVWDNRGAVSLFLGNGDGTFGSGTDFDTGGAYTPTSIAIADLNMDGMLDIAVSNLTPEGTVSVLLGNGDGTLGPKADFGASLDYFSSAVTIGDYNTDGKPDLAVAATYSTVSILPGNGDGTFGSKVDYHTGNNPISLATADLDDDGMPDLAVANSASNTISILSGNGDGTFGGVADFATGTYPISTAIGDLNADEKPDLAVTNYNSGTLSMLLGTGKGSFAPAVTFQVGTGPVSAAIGDINADGSLDIVVADQSTNYGYGSYGGTSMFLGNGNGTFEPRIESSGGILTYPGSVAIGDLTGDGRPDLAIAWAGYGAVEIRAEEYLLSTLLSAPGGIVVLGDLDADGRLDVVVPTRAWLANTDGTWFQRDIAPGSGRIASLAIGDLNMDGKLDLVMTKPDSNTVSVLLGNGDGTFGTSANFRAGGSPQSVAIQDLNADGKVDLAVANSSKNTVSVLLGNGDGTFQNRTDFGVGSEPTSVSIADLNADGKPDLAVANGGSNTVTALLNLRPGPTAISLVTLNVRAESGHVLITWYAPDAADARFTVQRRTPESDWSAVGQPSVDINNLVLFEDSDVRPGARYGYRLHVQGRSRQETSEESWVQISEELGAPAVVRLDQVRPNPFGDRTQFRYGIPKSASVRLVVYDTQGRRVASIMNETQAAGWRSISWNGRDDRGREVASGIYFARLESNGVARVTKIVIAR